MLSYSKKRKIIQTDPLPNFSGTDISSGFRGAVIVFPFAKSLCVCIENIQVGYNVIPKYIIADLLIKYKLKIGKYEFLAGI